MSSEPSFWSRSSTPQMFSYEDGKSGNGSDGEGNDDDSVYGDDDDDDDLIRLIVMCIWAWSSRP